MEWIPWERRKRGRPRKTRMEEVQAAMTTTNLEPDQWRNRQEWRLVSGRERQLLKKIPGYFMTLAVTNRSINPLNSKLNPICHLLALLEAHNILHVSRIRVKAV